MPVQRENNKTLKNRPEILTNRGNNPCESYNCNYREMCPKYANSSYFRSFERLPTRYITPKN